MSGHAHGQIDSIMIILSFNSVKFRPTTSATVHQQLEWIVSSREYAQHFTIVRMVAMLRRVYHSEGTMCIYLQSYTHTHYGLCMLNANIHISAHVTDPLMKLPVFLFNSLGAYSLVHREFCSNSTWPYLGSLSGARVSASTSFHVVHFFHNFLRVRLSTWNIVCWHLLNGRSFGFDFI